MAIVIHEIHRDPSVGLSGTISLCGHDDDTDPDIPDGMTRRMFHKVVDSHNVAALVAEVKAFATDVGTWLNVTDVYLYVGSIEAAENGPTLQVHPLVFAYTAPIA
jgi:hypothetical protein